MGLDGALEHAIEQARVETGLHMPVGHASIAQVPWDFRNRLERRFHELENIELYVLEKHDLALSKCVRGNAHDEQQLREIHKAKPFDFDTLVDRFRTEMTHVV